MTDRYNALIVILEEDVREDDAKSLISAIGQLRGVAKVEPNVAGPADHIAQARARHELRQKLISVIFPPDA